MSARKVCSGIRPSRLHSVRAISAPFRRPEARTLMPSAPQQLDARERISLEQISKASFVGTIYLVLLVMAALAFAGASVAVLMIK